MDSTSPEASALSAWIAVAVRRMQEVSTVALFPELVVSLKHCVWTCSVSWYKCLCLLWLCNHWTMWECFEFLSVPIPSTEPASTCTDGPTVALGVLLTGSVVGNIVFITLVIIRTKQLTQARWMCMWNDNSKVYITIQKSTQAVSKQTRASLRSTWPGCLLWRCEQAGCGWPLHSYWAEWVSSVRTHLVREWAEKRGRSYLWQLTQLSTHVYTFL